MPCSPHPNAAPRCMNGRRRFIMCGKREELTPVITLEHSALLKLQQLHGVHSWCISLPPLQILMNRRHFFVSKECEESNYQWIPVWIRSCPSEAWAYIGEKHEQRVASNRRDRSLWRRRQEGQVSREAHFRRRGRTVHRKGFNIYKIDSARGDRGHRGCVRVCGYNCD
jgi:hypothetical protein